MIDEEGYIAKKDRFTHDQIFTFHGSESSVNSRLDKSKLTPCTFGWVIKRLVNWRVAARCKYPNRRILAPKLISNQRTADIISTNQWQFNHAQPLRQTT